jgi:hypothetical protein
VTFITDKFIHKTYISTVQWTHSDIHRALTALLSAGLIQSKVDSHGTTRYMVRKVCQQKKCQVFPRRVVCPDVNSFLKGDMKNTD